MARDDKFLHDNVETNSDFETASALQKTTFVAGKANSILVVNETGGADFHITLNEDSTQHVVTPALPFGLDGFAIKSFTVVESGSRFLYRAAFP